MLSARSSAADFFGAGVVEDLCMMKQPCAAANSAASASGRCSDIRRVVLRRSRWRRILCFLEHAYSHAHRVIPLVDVNGGSGNATRERAHEKSSGQTDFFSREMIGYGGIHRAIID